MVYKLLDNKTGSAVTNKVTADVTEVLVQELYKAMVTDFKRSKGHPRLQENIWSIKIIVGSASRCITTLLLFILIFSYVSRRYSRLVQEVKDEVIPLK